MKEYVTSSLETHLFFGRIMKEHALFLQAGLPSSTTAISYRSEPMRNRMPLTHDPADSGEDTSMSSWVYGAPAPSILRAYVGDPAKIRLVHGGIKETHVFYLHNHQWRLEADLLPEYLEATPFQLRTRTDIVGHHVHLVKFDTITSDGAANGWNNIAGARKYETLVERFFADEELRSGTKAVIRRRDGTSFREFALFVHDFANLFDKDGNPLNPPAVPGGHDDPADRRGA